MYAVIKSGGKQHRVEEGEQLKLEKIEAATGERAQQNLMDMQPGDVPATWADASLLQTLTGYKPQTNVRDGVQAFVDWYRDYYEV